MATHGDTRTDYEILVMVQNPDFSGWPNGQKLELYQRAVDWHDYISDLKDRRLVTLAWGSQRVTGRVRWATNKFAFLAVYNVESLDEFSSLVMRDPLWDYGHYFMPILDSVEGDYENDLAGYEQARAAVEAKIGRKLPEPVLKYPYPMPTRRGDGKGPKLEIVVNSKNSAAYEDFSDAQRLDIFEKVLQMHDYHAKLRAAGFITYEWGHHQHCGLSDTVSRSGTVVYSADSYSQFDELFLSDPIREVSRVWTIILQPLEESRRLAVQAVEISKERVGVPV